MTQAQVLSIGVLNINSGKTCYDWSIYETWGEKTQAFLSNRGSLLFASPGTFSIGEEVELRGNDSQRRLHDCKIVDESPCTKEELLIMLKRNRYDYYPIKAFRSRADNNRKLGTSYSVKGTR